MSVMTKYFKHENGQYVFTGEKMHWYIPKRYENKNLLALKTPASVLGIFEIGIFPTKETKTPVYTGLVLPSFLSTVPNDIFSTMRRGVDCFCFEYLKNQVCINSDKFIKTDTLAYTTFNEFLELGNLPKFLTYNQRGFVFDAIQKYTGVKVRVDHAIFEMIYAHLSRDADNISVPYRYTAKKKPPIFIKIREISEAPDSSSSKLYGSYAGDGLNAVLTSTNKKSSRLENLLRE